VVEEDEEKKIGDRSWSRVGSGKGTRPAHRKKNQSEMARIC
jgi:hypothetical protein